MYLNNNKSYNEECSKKLQNVRSLQCSDKSTRPLSFNNPSFVTNNGHLTGRVNPKTLVQPIIKPPISSFKNWRHNKLTLPSQINHNSQDELYLSGYIPLDKCKNSIGCTESRFDVLKHEQIDDLKLCKKSHENYVSEHGQVDDLIVKVSTNHQNLINAPNSSQNKNKKILNRRRMKNKPSQIQHIDPNVFTTTHKPYIHQNIGISDTDSWRQKVPTTTENKVDNGTMIDTMFFEHKNKQNKNTSDQYINTSNVYDPRFTGYGSSKRSYWDSNVGQTRFMYDDVNCIRMPNYITRSKIDFLKYADSYGPLQSFNQHGNVNENLRSLVQDSYLQNSLKFRNELQERLLRKRNNELSQIRERPYHTNFK